MNIVILSGKGGTGKTTVATNLSRVLRMDYVDCDVEEPNGHIFLNPTIEYYEDVKILNPSFDLDKCRMCGACVEACQFNALAKVLTHVSLFKELCHGCGACVVACKHDAIQEVGRTVGKISVGTSNKQGFYSGKLNIREPMGGPIISKLKEQLNPNRNVLLDSSPGTSCSVVKTLAGADYALLVTEPTKFGLHDLKLAISLVREMKISFGVVVNRYTDENNSVCRYCATEDISIIGKIPFSRKAAELYSKGQLLIEDPLYSEIFNTIGKNLIIEIGRRSS